MYMYMYIHVYSHTRTHNCTYINICIYVCKNGFLNTTHTLSLYMYICIYTQVYTTVHACMALNCMIVTTRAKIMSEAEKPQFFPAFEAAPDSEDLKPCTLNRSPKLVQTQQDRAQLQPTRRARRHRIGGYDFRRPAAPGICHSVIMRRRAPWLQSLQLDRQATNPQSQHPES